MNQWDKEYKKPVLVTKHDQPQKETLRFLKFAKKEGFRLGGAKILDLGSGTGRNANYLAKEGAEITGLETSTEAVKLAKRRAAKEGIGVTYLNRSIGAKMPFPDDQFDLAIDVLTSHLLTETERGVYLAELHRVLKKRGWLFVKTLAKEGDANAQNLLKEFPGAEKDTYVLPDIRVTERVFTEADFRDTFGKYFEIVHFEKKTSLIPFKNQIYKRRFIIAYLQNK